MDRCGFFNTLIYLGVTKFISGFGEKRDSEAHTSIRKANTIGGQSGEAQVSGGGNHTVMFEGVSVSQAFYRLLHEHILPFTAKLMIGSVVKVASSLSLVDVELMRCVVQRGLDTELNTRSFARHLG